MSITQCVGLTAMAVIWFGAKPTGYLARVGPAPLRFQAPTRGPEVTVALPPLMMSDPAPVSDEPFGPPAPQDEPPLVLAPVEPGGPLAPTPNVVQPMAIDPLAAFTPQMLIQFFNKNGTNQDYNLLVPYQFTPPPANLPAPPSKATYTKTKE